MSARSMFAGLDTAFICFMVVMGLGFVAGVFGAVIVTDDAKAEILDESRQQNEDRRLCLEGNDRACRLWEARQ